MIGMRVAAAAIGGAVMILAGSPAALAGTVAPNRAEPVKVTSARSVSHGFIGYDWQVVAISHDGKVTRIPARRWVDLQFSRGGQFAANDSVNFHSGTYRTTRDGFTTSALGSTLVGYAGHDPAVLLAISAIGSFDNGAHATVKLTGHRLVVRVHSYTLNCQRHALLPGQS
ncbi:MAG TPA: hypothetical protein VE733_13185 [Streptosporangiaceae bacterium]|jgi:heat shock protein HslJ|nr:hypothetical protein [Streptosporangiaceae bacterium]